MRAGVEFGRFRAWFAVEDERYGWLCLWHFLAISSVEYHHAEVELPER